MATNFRYKHLRGTTEQWNNSTIVPLDGELVIEERTDGTVEIKVGNGKDLFGALPYISKENITMSDLHADLQAIINGKVNSVDGKGLSENDLTDELKGNYDDAYEHSRATHARTDATKVEASATNGKIKIDGVETTVYTHPSGTNPHGTTKSDVGLGNVENKSSATIRGEITSGNVTDALGYTPLDEDDAYVHPTSHPASMITGLAKVATSGAYGDLSGTPDSLPADGGNADTVDGKHASDFATAAQGALAATAYQKPSTGIPKSDLSSAVQTSLGLADSAIQSLDGYATEKYVDDAIDAIPTPDVSGQISTHNSSNTAHQDIRDAIPTVYDWAKAASKPSYNLGEISDTSTYVRMTSTERNNLNTIVKSFDDDDSNTTIDTIKEVLKAFENAPEGTDIANALAGKAESDHTHTYSNTTGSKTTGVTVSSTDAGHTHSFSASLANGSAAGAGKHTHTVTATGTVASEDAGHTHSFSASLTSGKAASGGGHDHTVIATGSVAITDPEHTHTASSTFSSGSAAAQKFTGSAVDSGAPAGTTPTTVVAAQAHTHSYTPAGSVSQPTFTGTAATIAKTGTTATTVASEEHKHSVTAAGTVSKPTFTGTAATIAKTGTTGTTVASSTHTHTIDGLKVTAPETSSGSGVYRLTFTTVSATTGITGTVTVAAQAHTHSYTPAGTVSQPTFTGTAVTSAAPSETVDVAAQEHTHSYTPAGTVSKPTFSGTAATIAKTGTTGTTVASSTHTHSVTAAGTNAASTVTGSVSTTITEAETGVTAAFTGTSATTSSNGAHTHTVSGSVSGTTGEGTADITSTFTGTSATTSEVANHTHTVSGSVSGTSGSGKASITSAVTDPGHTHSNSGTTSVPVE